MPNKETLVLKRIPPGDNWKDINDEENTFDSLTKALSFVYKSTKIKEFHVSAKDGMVWVITDEVTKDEDVDSLYGD